MIFVMKINHFLFFLVGLEGGEEKAKSDFGWRELTVVADDTFLVIIKFLSFFIGVGEKSSKLEWLCWSSQVTFSGIKGGELIVGWVPEN